MADKHKVIEIIEAMENTIVRGNLMKDKNYSPYCGGIDCKGLKRTSFNGQQFTCSCGWISSFPDDFIKSYKEKHNL